MSRVLIRRVKDERSDIEKVATESIVEALSHIRDFSYNGEIWSKYKVAEICYNIGEILFDRDGLDSMKTVYCGVAEKMRGDAAIYLNGFWNGIGDGAWRM